ncbi:hypothetical protein QP164_07430 [Sphingomonas sp. LR59]|uniref:hypothetical protein n=1 Tax=Sphingomonas sp. LR59 TaxID=3050232 RepID=UPI002FE072E1
MQTYRRRLLATTLFVGAVTIAAPAVAQTAPTEAPVTDPAASQPAPDQPTAQSAADPAAQATGRAAQGDEPAGDIVVTGSRISSPSATAASPLQSISADLISTVRRGQRTGRVAPEPDVRRARHQPYQLELRNPVGGRRHRQPAQPG